MPDCERFIQSEYTALSSVGLGCCREAHPRLALYNAEAIYWCGGDGGWTESEALRACLPRSGLPPLYPPPPLPSRSHKMSGLRWAWMF